MITKWDTTGDLVGARPVALHGRGAWFVDKIDLDRIEKYAESYAFYEYICLDLELPDVIAFDASVKGVDAVKRGIDVWISIIERIHKTTRQKVAIYDTFIDYYTPITNAYESRLRRVQPRGDGADAHFINNFNLHMQKMGECQWVFDVLRPVHDAQQWICARAYMPFDADATWKREGIIDWAWGEGLRQSRGQKPVLLLIKPNRQSGKKRVEHSLDDMRIDAELCNKARVKNVLFWRDQTTTPEAVRQFASYF